PGEHGISTRKFLFDSGVDCSPNASTLLFRVYKDAGHEFSRMIHVRYIDQFPEAYNPVPFKIDTFEPFQEILCPVHALVTATTFRYADTIVRIIRIIDLNQPFVIAGTKLSEPDGERLLLAHDLITMKGLCQASPDSLLNCSANGGTCERIALHVPLGPAGGGGTFACSE